MATAELPPGVKIRRANLSDQAAVAAIGDVFHGMDYMEYMYPFYMHSPDYLGYVLELNGTPISFAYRYIVDDGETLISGGERTHPDYRGQGYQTLLKAGIRRSLVDSREKPFKRFVATSFDLPSWREKARAEPEKTNIFITRQLHSFQTTKAAVRENVSSQRFGSLKDTCSADIWHAADNEVGDIFTNNVTNKRLFPEGHFIAYYEPYLARASNMRLARVTSKLILSGDRTRGTVRAMSLISEIPCLVGLRYDMEFYGSAMEDLLQHLYFYMENLVSLPLMDKVVVQMAIYLPRDMDRDVVRRTANEFGWTPGAWQQYPNYIAIEMKH